MNIDHLPFSKEDTTVLLPDHCKNIDFLADRLNKLILTSQTNATWSKHKTVWNCFYRFIESENIQLNWPVDIKILRAFTVWGLCFKNLSPATVKSYLSSIKLFQEMKGFTCVDYGKDKTIQLVLKGANNVKLLSSEATNCRRAISLHTLLLLGHRIACSSWCRISKQVIWTACVISFFTGARMGELLAPQEYKFDPCTTLLWKDIMIMENKYMLIFLPHTKTKGLKGEFIDLFPFENSPCCPIKCILKLKEMHLHNNTLEQNLPVFMFSSGRFLTTAKLNGILKNLLPDIFENKEGKITCHSFRAGIPSTIGNSTDCFLAEDVKNFGRWRGNSYQLYIRLERQKRELLYRKIYSVLSNMLE